MQYVYLIKSARKDFFYVGCTNDLPKRLERHNKRQILSTRNYAPFKLIYYEAYQDARDAFEREKKLKHHGSAIGHLKRRVKWSATR